MYKHVTIVGILWIGLSYILLIGAGVYPFLLLRIGREIGGDFAVLFFALFGIGVGVMLTPMFYLAIFGGIGLLQWRPWARNMVLTASVIELINVPIGTMLGAYSIWVLSHQETVDLFKRLKE